VNVGNCDGGGMVVGVMELEQELMILILKKVMLLYQEKQMHTHGVNTKTHSRTMNPSGYIMEWEPKKKKTKGTQVSANLLHSNFLCCFLLQHWGKDAAETNACAKEKIADKMLCQV
jgi:hypothetical protein